MDFNIHGGPGSSPPQIKREGCPCILRGLCCSVSKEEERHSGEKGQQRNPGWTPAVMAVWGDESKEKRKWPWEGEDLSLRIKATGSSGFNLESLLWFPKAICQGLCLATVQAWPHDPPSWEVPNLSALGTATQWERPAISSRNEISREHYKGIEHDKGQVR